MMKNALKTITILLMALLTIGVAAAIPPSLDLTWNDYTTQTAISNGESAEFFATISSGTNTFTNLQETAKLYKSTGQLVGTVYSRSCTSASMCQSMIQQNVHAVLPANYQSNSGNYVLEVDVQGNIVGSSYPYVDFAEISLSVNPATPINHAPVLQDIQNQQVTEENFFSYQMQVSDVDGDALTCYAVNMPSWLSVNPNTCVISGTAPQVVQNTDYSITVGVSDGSLSDEDQFYLTVLDVPAPVNHAPVIQHIPNHQINEGTEYIYFPEISDPDGDDITCYAISMPSWLSINENTCVISGTAPLVLQNTQFHINFGATDGDLTDTEDYQLTVIDITPINHAPVLQNIPDQDVLEGEYYSYQMQVSDVDGDALTCYAVNMPSWLSINSNTCVISGTAPQVMEDTQFNLAVGVTDGSLSDEDAYVLTVRNIAPTNHAPNMQDIPDQQVNENTAYTYQTVVSDADNDPLSCSAVQMPSWLSINSNTCIISGTTPSVDEDATFHIVVRVSDGSLYDDEDYYLTVLNSYVPNIAPVAAFTWSPSAPVVGEPVQFDGSGSYDVDGQIVQYTWTIDGNFVSSQQTFTYGFNAAGTYQVALTVTDDDGASDSVTHSITVDMQELVLDELSCNSDVVQGQEQHCSAHVQGNVEDAKIIFKYSGSNSVLGECHTNFKGYCHINPIINLPEGNYEVYAEAFKAGYEPDVTRDLRTTFRVWVQRYIIQNLRTYEDAYVNEEYTFYRTRPVYAAFDVYDTFTNTYIPQTSGLIDHVFLRVNNAHPVNFTIYGPIELLDARSVISTDRLVRIDADAGMWRYYLSNIPTTDDVLGEGKVFAFVFNFSDNTAGQDSVNVNILNNELEFNPPSQITISPLETISLDLKAYAQDIETPDSEIVFSAGNSGTDLVITNIGNGVFSIHALESFTDQETVFFTADDTDGSVVTKPILFSSTGPLSQLPVAIILGPENVKMGTQVTLDASKSYDPDGGDIILYSWKVYRYGTLVNSFSSERPEYQYKLDLNGEYVFELIVTDDEGEKGTASKKIFSSRNYDNGPVIGKEDGVWVDYFDIYGTGYGTINAEEPFEVSVTVSNDRKDDLDMHVTFSLPEIGYVEKSQSFDLDAGDTEQVKMIISLPFYPGEIEPGEYTALITVAGDGIIRTKYYPVIIE